MIEGEKIELFSWFRIYFIENEGMAYGITLGSKLFLTLFRIVAMTVGSFYLARMVKRGTYPVGFLVCLAMIIAGGFGNVIDCIFYGKIFSSSIGQVAQFVPWGSGYGEPFWAGEPFIFFGPIFNFADACISVGVFLLLVCYPRLFSQALEGLSQDKK